MLVQSVQVKSQKIRLRIFCTMKGHSADSMDGHVLGGVGARLSSTKIVLRWHIQFLNLQRHCSTMADSPKGSLSVQYCLFTLTNTTTSLHYGYQQRCILHLPIGSNGTSTNPSDDQHRCCRLTAIDQIFNTKNNVTPIIDIDASCRISFYQQRCWSSYERVQAFVLHGLNVYHW